MSFAAHGNWCGPGWSAGQWKDAKDLTEEDKQVEAVDALDQACKNHDIRIAEGDTEANKKFEEEAGALGIKGAVFAALVSRFGPSSQSILQNQKQMARLRTSKKNAENKEQIRPYQKRRSGAEAQVKEALQNDAVAGDVTGLSFVKAVHEAFDEEEKEEAEDAEMVETLIDLDGNFITPDRPTMRAAPTLTRGEREPLSNLLDQVDNDIAANSSMKDTNMEIEPMALRSVGTQTDGGENQRGNQETMVRYNSRSEMGIFTETRTAYLPLTVYFSINRTQINAPIALHFRVDWPFNIFSRNSLAQQFLQVGYNDAQVRTQGLSNDMAFQGQRQSTITPITLSAANLNTVGHTGKDPAFNRGQLYPFPTTVVGNVAARQGTAVLNGFSSWGGIDDTSAIPAYRRWYAKMYQYAHCMETDWKVTYMHGDTDQQFQNMRVYQGLDCQSTGNTDVIPKDVELGTIDHWAYLKKHNVVSRSEETAQRTTTISGQWRPGMQHPMKMIPNTEEIKTWTKLGATDFIDRNPNAYREDVTLLHYSHPDSINSAAFVNVRVDLRYKVQFKDLDNKLRWPKANITQLTLTNLDTIQIPYPTQSVGVAAQPERIYCDGVTPR